MQPTALCDGLRVAAELPRVRKHDDEDDAPRQGVECEGMGWVRTEWDGVGWDGLEWNGVGGMGRVRRQWDAVGRYLII